jgi:hypothetical protein
VRFVLHELKFADREKPVAFAAQWRKRKGPDARRDFHPRMVALDLYDPGAEMNCLKEVLVSKLAPAID